MKYTDVSGSCGYAYNWVFAKDFLFNASLSMALAYNQSMADVEREENKKTREFSFRNFNLDGIGRFALVWNNTTGMPVQAPSCIPIIIRRTVSQPTTPSESSTSMWESTLAENDRFVF